MTLNEAAKLYWWSVTHDYAGAVTESGKIVAIFGLGIWERDLRRLEEQIPNLVSWTRSRVTHDDDDWLRVDLREVRPGEDLP